ncbi:hypothetical protein U1Q18_038137 [Sarracenia purpurea var. burkii]
MENDRRRREEFTQMPGCRSHVKPNNPNAAMFLDGPSRAESFGHRCDSSCNGVPPCQPPIYSIRTRDGV